MSHTHNLVIIHTPGLQDIGDFHAIRSSVTESHPEIRTAIVSTVLAPEQLRTIQSNALGAVTVSLNADPRNRFWVAQATKPTLIFSPIPVRLPRGIRGYRLIARHISKLDEIDMLRSKGFPVPRSAILSPTLALDEAIWGPMVIIKPTTGRGGGSIRLVRTRDVAALAERASSEHQEQEQQFMVQQWIDTGQLINSYRVMTVLDCVAYVNQSLSLEAELLTEELPNLQAVDVASNSRSRRIIGSNEPDVYELGARIAQHLTFSPTFGIDIVRDHRNGQLFVLELNSGFPTWHLSSRAAKRDERKMGTFTLDERYRQYNALRNIGDALARATQRYAL